MTYPTIRAMYGERAMLIVSDEHGADLYVDRSHVACCASVEAAKAEANRHLYLPESHDLGWSVK